MDLVRQIPPGDGEDRGLSLQEFLAWLLVPGIGKRFWPPVSLFQYRLPTGQMAFGPGFLVEGKVVSLRLPHAPDSIDLLFEAYFPERMGEKERLLEEARALAPLLGE